MPSSDENRTNARNPIPASLCKTGCGFYGTPATNGLCSKCHTAQMAEQAASALENLALGTDLRVKIRQPAFVWPAAKSTDNSARDTSPSPPPTPRAPSRCRSCQKKTGLVAFNCRCGYAFCVAHRYPETHDCTFDFRAAGRVEIAKANPLVKPDKIQRI